MKKVLYDFNGNKIHDVEIEETDAEILNKRRSFGAKVFKKNKIKRKMAKKSRRNNK